MWSSIPEKCIECGRFLKLNETNISYVPFGSSTDFEPPDPNYVHFECWDKLSEDQKELTKRASWIKPHSLGDLLQE